MQTRLRGIVLHKQPLNDHDLLITIFSPDHGRFKAVVNKAKKKPGFAAGLELFSETEFILNLRENLSQIYQVDLITAINKLRTDYIAYQTASGLAQIIYKATTFQQPHPELYNLFKDCLFKLEHGQSVYNVRKYFRETWLKIEGLATDNIEESDFKEIFNQYTGEDLG